MLNQSLNTVSFEPQSDGLYANYKVGADSVRKKLGSNVITVGSGLGTFNVKNLTTDFAKLTINDFYIQSFTVVTQHNTGGDASSQLEKSYNKSTGILTISASTYVGNGYVNTYIGKIVAVIP